MSSLFFFPVFLLKSKCSIDYMMVTICYSIWLSSAASTLDSDTFIVEAIADEKLRYHCKWKAQTIMKLGKVSSKLVWVFRRNCAIS